jgi:hypothetical protein
MEKVPWKDLLGWGFSLWLLGYLLGIILFFAVPGDAIGYFIMPIGIVAMLWVLVSKIGHKPFHYYMKLALCWTIMAIVLDYVFIVTLFNSVGYYKLDVYLYYLVTFVFPLLVGWINKNKK